MNPIFLKLIPLLLGIVAIEPGEVRSTVTRLVVQDDVIWRVPIQPRRSLPIEWKEHKGPKCIPVAAIRGAVMSGSDHLDFVLTDRSRIRAEFDGDCDALDYYGNFYLQPEDDRLCARRDDVHSRMGGSCRIERFRVLVPKLKH